MIEYFQIIPVSAAHRRHIHIAVMILKKYLKYSLLCLAVFLVGASVAAALKFAYGFEAIPGIERSVTERLSLRDWLVIAAEFLTPLVILLISSFTMYACAVGMAVSLIIGIRLGILAIAYCTSGLNPFTHAAVLLFLLAFAAICSYAGTVSALYRNTLRYAAPDPSEILRAKATSPVFFSFLSLFVITAAVSTAIYFFAVYFPIPA